MKKCALIIRVSTDRQAGNPEGSLKNQLQRLRAHIEYKRTACGEEWEESDRYVLKAVSGKDSLRSPEFVRLFEDMRAGRINTVLCTALDRICRSVKDFLSFFEILNHHGLEFVSVKENVDTTTAQGRLFATILMALAEFEREQTSERTSEATAARAERGLWNGGQILGYDLPNDQKGTLVPNARETAVVNFAYDTYLKTGSILETAKALNERGYRSKEYTSRRGKYHPPKKFTWSPVHWMLTNCAYVGKKEVNKKKRALDQSQLPEDQRYRVVDAAWPPIVDEEKFNAVQRLMAANSTTNTNQARRVRHTYIFNGGLLWCGECGQQMEGRAGTGHQGIRYYYYGCRNKECGFKIPAPEIERVVLERLRELSQEEGVVADLVAHTNRKLQKELPQLEEQKGILEKELAEIRDFADGVMAKWARLATSEGSIFLKDKLESLAERRKEVEAGIASLETMIDEVQRESVSQELVMMALGKITDVFDSLQPYQKKEMIRLILHRAELSKTKLRLAFYGRPPQEGVFGEKWKPESAHEKRSPALAWLPG